MASVQVNIRTTKFLVNELDKIVEEGYFRSRSEAMNEGIRLILKRYNLAKLESKLIKAKKLSKDLPSVTDALIKSREDEDS